MTGGSVAFNVGLIDYGLTGVVCLAGEVVVWCPVLVPTYVSIRRVPVPA